VPSLTVSVNSNLNCKCSDKTD